MTALKYGIIILFAITAFTALIFAFRTKKPLKFVLFNAFTGACLLLILYLTRKLTGINLLINQYTVLLSASFGIPAVIVFLILNFLIFV